MYRFRRGAVMMIPIILYFYAAHGCSPNQLPRSSLQRGVAPRKYDLDIYTNMLSIENVWFILFLFFIFLSGRGGVLSALKQCFRKHTPPGRHRPWCVYIYIFVNSCPPTTVCQLRHDDMQRQHSVPFSSTPYYKRIYILT